MKIMRKVRKIKRKVMAVMTAFAIMTSVAGNPVMANAEGMFNPAFYATTYADVATALGTDADVLYNHYVMFGQAEGRLPYAGATAGESVNGIADATTTATVAAETPTATDITSDGIVPIDKLQNYASLKAKMTDAEFQAAYNEALKIVQPLVGLSKEEQAKKIMSTLRGMVDNGQVSYSTKLPHYSNAYGYLINHAASCAGSTRTTGLCLNMLGINYEHVHPNQWCHQWCRADINGVTWVVDPYAYTCTAEAYAYWHPLADCGQ